MRVLVTTSVRNEGPYLLEWIAWYRTLGVTDFLIYSNDCDDGTDKLLDLLARHDVIHHEVSEPPSERSIQWNAFRAAWRHDLRKVADWMLITDVDEFPVIHAGDGKLSDLIAGVPENADAITLPWRLFGSNGKIGISGKPVTAEFTRSAPEVLHHPISATFFKSMFRPKSFRGPGVHRPRHRKDSSPVWVDGSGVLLPQQLSQQDKALVLLGYDRRKLVDLHHYSLRSAHAFLVKAERGLPNHMTKKIELGYWVERNFNTEENYAAQRYDMQFIQELEALKALPGVTELHDASLNWHRYRASNLIKTDWGYHLYRHILLAGDSIVQSPYIQNDLLRLSIIIQRQNEEQQLKS